MTAELTGKGTDMAAESPRSGPLRQHHGGIRHVSLKRPSVSFAAGIPVIQHHPSRPSARLLPF
jgi:hypothetical protein